MTVFKENAIATDDSHRLFFARAKSTNLLESGTLMKGRKQSKYSALDLLRQYLELCRYTPDHRDWNERALEKNPPRLIRLQRLKALFHAFGILFDPSSFQEGDFIDWKDPVYEVFLERARSQFLREEAEGRLSGTIELTAFYLKPVFESLLKYRIALDESLYFNH
jgi:hypothetical protein